MTSDELRTRLDDIQCAAERGELENAVAQIDALYVLASGSLDLAARVRRWAARDDDASETWRRRVTTRAAKGIVRGEEPPT